MGWERSCQELYTGDIDEGEWSGSGRPGLGRGSSPSTVAGGEWGGTEDPEGPGGWWQKI